MSEPASSVVVPSSSSALSALRKQALGVVEERAPRVLESRRIKVHVLGDNYSVWDADEVYTLRVKYRVVGGLTGLLPGSASQVAVPSLPLLLSFEELALLNALDAVDVIDAASLLAPPSPAAVVAHYEAAAHTAALRQRLGLINAKVKENFFRAQSKRKAEAGGDGDNAARKRRPVVSGSASLAMCGEWRAKASAHSAALTATHALMRTPPLVPTAAAAAAAVTPPHDTPVSAPRCTLRLRSGRCLASRHATPAHCAVFAELWRRGFWLTSASKFGGDYLAYMGDPLQFHADLVVVVAPSAAPLLLCEVAALGRLANAVKKAGVVASAAFEPAPADALLYDADAPVTVDFLSITWRSMTRR